MTEAADSRDKDGPDRVKHPLVIIILGFATMFIYAFIRLALGWMQGTPSFYMTAYNHITIGDIAIGASILLFTFLLITIGLAFLGFNLTCTPRVASWLVLGSFVVATGLFVFAMGYSEYTFYITHTPPPPYDPSIDPVASCLIMAIIILTLSLCPRKDGEKEGDNHD